MYDYQLTKAYRISSARQGKSAMLISQLAPIINYITTYRLEKAKELLLNPDIPVGTVALKVGYGNYSYFSKLFKDVIGCTPNEYRKK